MTDSLKSPRRHLLVVGGYGATGSGIVDAVRKDPSWRVTTAGRRLPPDRLLDGSMAPEHVTVDLLSAGQAVTAFSPLKGITDLAYCAYVDAPTMAAATKPNVAMLANALEALTAAGAQLQRIILIGGGKSYGPHLGLYKTPAKESDSRIMGPMFYDDQEDHLREWSRRHGATWTILRPDGIVGTSLGSPMNIVNGIATFATISRELGIPLRFPGSAAAWSALHQLTDAGILGNAAMWALESEAARDDIFNVTNGDQFRWRHLWGDIAHFFEMPIDEFQPMSLVTQMEDKGPVWDRIVRKNSLRPTSWNEIAAWPFIDGILNIGFDLVQSTVKIRQAGFDDCIDTHESVLRQLRRLREFRLIP